MDVIRFICPACGAKLKAPIEQTGKVAVCPRCSGKMKVPAPAATERPPWENENLPQQEKGPESVHHTPGAGAAQSQRPEAGDGRSVRWKRRVAVGVGAACLVCAAIATRIYLGTPPGNGRFGNSISEPKTNIAAFLEKAQKTLEEIQDRIDEDAPPPVPFSGFHRFVSGDDGFEIGFPAKPNTNKYAIATEYSIVTEDGVGYSVIVSELPETFVDNEADVFLRSGLQSKLSLLKKSGARLTSSKRCKFLGHEALAYEYQLEMAGMDTCREVTAVLIGKRLYSISAYYLKENSQSARYRDFIGSFKYRGFDSSKEEEEPPLSATEAALGATAKRRGSGLVSGLASTAEWTSYKQPGGGNIDLPDDWTMVNLSAPVQMATGAEDGTLSKSQGLINAKGVHNEVVCSVKASRTWQEDKLGKPLPLSQDKPGKALDMIVSALEKAGNPVLLQPRREIQGTKELWRTSLSMLNGNSRMDVCYVRSGDILYFVSAIYNKKEQAYWSKQFTEILSRWKPSTELGEEEPEVPAMPEEWVRHRLPEGIDIQLPESWKVVKSDYPEEREAVEATILILRRALNARPAEFDSAVFQVMSFRAEDARDRKSVSVPLTNEDLTGVGGELFADASIGTMKAVGKPRMVFVQFGETRWESYRFEVPAHGLKLDTGITFCSLKGERISLLFMGSYLPKDKEPMEAAMLDVAKRVRLTSRSAPLPIR